MTKNTKHEIRSTKQIQIFKKGNVLNIRIWNLDIVSNFDIRISNFIKMSKYKPQFKTIARKAYNAIYWLLLFNMIALGWPGRALAISVTGDGDAFYGYGANTAPKRSYYTNSTNTFAASADAATANATINWSLIKASPTQDLLIGGVLSTNATNNLTIMTSDGSNTNWTVAWQVTTTNTTYRGFDIAFEDSTGDAMVVYSDATATPKYRAYTASTQTWDGSSSSITVARTSGDVVRWVKLATNPGTDTIGFAYSTSSATGNNVNALVWSGSAWGNEPGAGNAFGLVVDAVRDGFDLSYETSSNDLIVIWTRIYDAVNNTTYNPYYAELSGGTWSGPARVSATSVGVNQAHIRLVGDPATSSNCIVGASLDNTATTPDLHLYRWSGSGWTVEADEDTSTLSYNSPHMDLAYAGTTGQAVLLYADVNTGVTMTIRYSNACGAWTVASGGTSPTAGAATRYIKAYSDPSSSNILFLGLENTAAGDLTAYKYTYAASPTLAAIAETTGSPITTDTSTVITEPFGFAYERLNLVPTLTELLFTILIGCVVFLGIKTGVIKWKKSEPSPGKPDQIDPKDIQSPPNDKIDSTNSHQNKGMTYQSGIQTRHLTMPNQRSIDGITRNNQDKLT
ncbi:MAG: hypothetical protein HW405_267 [Candidatus Berkelbacteria bacterium]|nr:hypothetical protein [Candidatus Berkelbacteria bacterium]